MSLLEPDHGSRVFHSPAVHDVKMRHSDWEADPVLPTLMAKRRKTLPSLVAATKPLDPETIAAANRVADSLTDPWRRWIRRVGPKGEDLDHIERTVEGLASAIRAVDPSDPFIDRLADALVAHPRGGYPVPDPYAHAKEVFARHGILALTQTSAIPAKERVAISPVSVAALRRVYGPGVDRVEMPPLYRIEDGVYDASYVGGIAWIRDEDADVDAGIVANELSHHMVRSLYPHLYEANPYAGFLVDEFLSDATSIDPRGVDSILSLVDPESEGSDLAKAGYDLSHDLMRWALRKRDPERDWKSNPPDAEDEEFVKRVYLLQALFVRNQLEAGYTVSEVDGVEFRWVKSTSSRWPLHPQSVPL